MHSLITPVLGNSSILLVRSALNRYARARSETIYIYIYIYNKIIVRLKIQKEHYTLNIFTYIIYVSAPVNFS